MSTPGEKYNYGGRGQPPSVVVQLAIKRRKVAYRCTYCGHLFRQDDALSRAKELGLCPNCKDRWDPVQVI